MAPLRPCILERKLLPKVWGGSKLAEVLGIELPKGEAIGETWEVFDRPDGSNAIRGSEQTLRDLMQEDSVALLGKGVMATGDGRFPLLIKYIDANARLSVQVHPDAMQARAEGDGGKNEAWVVLHREEYGQIICGFRDGVTAERFAAVAHTSEVEELLAVHQPECYESFYVPAGTVHAMGPGVVVFEVQQNSDITYRLYDWGRDREVHVDKVLQVARVAPYDPRSSGRQRINQQTEYLLRTPDFATCLTRVKSPCSIGSEGTFKILSVVQGQGTLGWHSGGTEPPLMFSQGDTILIPACAEVCFLSPIGDLELLVTGPGI